MTGRICSRGERDGGGGGEAGPRGRGEVREGTRYREGKIKKKREKGGSK